MADPLGECLKSFLREIIREEIQRALAEHGNGKPAPLEVDGKEAARLLSLPLSWVMNAARRKQIPCVKHGHHVRFKVADLEIFINEQCQSVEVPALQGNKFSIGEIRNPSL